MKNLSSWVTRKLSTASVSLITRGGVAILIPNSVQFEDYKQINDKNGRYVVVKGKLQNEIVKLVNVYAHQKVKTIFSNPCLIL